MNTGKLKTQTPHSSARVYKSSNNRRKGNCESEEQQGKGCYCSRNAVDKVDESSANKHKEAGKVE